MLKYKLSLIFGLLYCINSHAQLVIDNSSQTVEQFVQNVLLGGGVTISNVQYNGGPANVPMECVGEFNDPSAFIGFTNGLIMGSGDVSMASQPNTSGSSSVGGTGAAGTDTDLQSITPNQIYDECVIEFDFIPSGDSLTFNYVFASEEYEEYVCGTVNDAFGFFLTGPNPLGGNYTALNIALVPDPANPGQYTTTPVSINTINPGVAGTNGQAGNCTAIDPNWASYNVFYTQNPGNNYEYDGRTVTLTAAAAVKCGQQYHIKLAIGDGGDNAFDSGVFLEGNSFNSNGLSIAANTTFVYEGCPGAYYIVTRPDTTLNDVVNLVIQGSAINGTDYTFLPDSIIFDQGALTDTIWLNVNAFDGDTNYCDTVEIFIDDSSACGGPIIKILQADPLEVSITDGDTICTQDPINQSHFFTSIVTGGVPGVFNYNWNTYPPYNFPGATQNDTSITVEPESDTYFTLTVVDGCGAVQTSEGMHVVLQCPLTIPNVFTPNGDGINDYFEIVNLDHYPNSRLEVYSRWGNKVFESDNYQNNWDGGDVTDGVYYYVLYPNGHTRPQKPVAGTVNIFAKK